MVELKGDHCDFTQRRPDEPIRWFLVQSQLDVSFVYDDNGVPRIAKEGDKNVYAHFFPPRHLIGFSTWPGSGCEQANFGMCKFPRTVSIPHRIGTKPGKHGELAVLSDTKKAKLELSKGEWRWRGFCKTQYANDPARGGLENFLRCHLCVVAMLDTAKKIGFEVTVTDNGGYWEKRDVQDLVQQIGSWDAFVAALAGGLKDANDDPNLNLQAPIMERKDFEQLEAKGQSMLPPNVSEVLKKLFAITQPERKAT